MNDQNMLKLIEFLGRENITDHINLKGKITELLSKEVIRFFTISSKTRKVNDFGRDEDTDTFLCLGMAGWESLTTVIEYGVGNTQLNESLEKPMTNEEVLEELKNADLKSYINFILIAHNLISESPRKFGY